MAKKKTATGGGSVMTEARRPLELSAARHPRPSRTNIGARYDAAQTTRENSKHWANADNLTADQANNPTVRATLRIRSGYELDNNSYGSGISRTYVDDVVGTGPRLLASTPDRELNRKVEFAFSRWADTVNLAEKLYIARLAQLRDGEAFIQMYTKRRKDRGGFESAITLDLSVIEAARVANPYGVITYDAKNVDGIILDDDYEPIQYKVLKPDQFGNYSTAQYEVIPASAMIHMFRKTRPGQHRGIPELMSSLPLFAQLRRYTSAVVTAAETAACISGVIYTDAPVGGEAELVEPMDMVDIERNTFMTLPGGWKGEAFDSKQPTNTYGDFKQELINEVARSLSMPFNIAACNSAKYNYASGRMDHQTYFKAINVDRARVRRQALDRVLYPFLREFALSENIDWNYLLGIWSHSWMFDGQEHVDPEKEANAQAIRLANGTTTLAHELGQKGIDWETSLEQRSKEIARCKELGIPLPAGAGGTSKDSSDKDSSKQGE